jgi:hypothetical protein
MCRITTALVFLLFATSSSSLAQESRERPIELVRISRPIVVDGVMNDEGWREVPVLPAVMYAPVFKGQPTQRTDLRVAYDEANLYVGGWFYDSDPKGIRINSLYRDRWNGDDTLAIYIDAFNDNQNAKWFGITPAGMRFDALVSDDGNTLNDNWDGFWTGGTTVTSDGWFVEVRIPFSTIGFQPDAEGRVVMGLTLTRLVSRLGERVTFPAIDPKFLFRRPSMAQRILLRGVTARKPLYVTPYALGGVTTAATSSARVETTEAGGDVRYPFTSDLTLDLTVNTDFAQVEADEQQVALDRFPLFYPERRRFFQEGAGLFDFVTANGTRLFHSRRIGLTPALQPVRILGGARLVGRVGAWDVGLLDVQTDHAATLPGENLGVGRGRRQVLNPSSTAGLMMTTYSGGGRDNVGVGGDTAIQIKGDDYVVLKAASVFDQQERAGADLVSRSIFDARWERRTGRGLAYNWQFARAGADYRPELGFMPRRNFTTANVATNWYFFTDRHKYFRRVYPGALASSTFRNTDSALESGQYAFWVQWDTKAGGGGWVEPKWFRENVLAPFGIGRGVTIPAGVYDFADLQLNYTMPSGSRLRTNVDFRSGTYFDGTRTQVIVDPTWNASKFVELGASYQLTRLRFDTRSQRDTIQLLALRVRTALNTKASGNAFIQYNSTSSRLDVNVRLRYNFAEGTDLWIVYNEGLNTERGSLGTDSALTPLSLSRALIVKYSHTLSF